MSLPKKCDRLCTLEKFLHQFLSRGLEEHNIFLCMLCFVFHRILNRLLRVARGRNNDIQTKYKAGRSKKYLVLGII